jgi:uncharacterized RmlC-like cupin family protein
MDWKEHGIEIVWAADLDSNTPQTPGMTRAAAITHARTGASKLWAGTVLVEPDAKTGPHHHGDLETMLYIVRGWARMRWANGWSSARRLVPAISSTCRRTCHIRRSMLCRMSPAKRSWSEAGRSQSW